jgi:hypothetical protein
LKCSKIVLRLVERAIKEAKGFSPGYRGFTDYQALKAYTREDWGSPVVPKSFDFLILFVLSYLLTSNEFPITFSI